MKRLLTLILALGLFSVHTYIPAQHLDPTLKSSQKGLTAEQREYYFFFEAPVENMALKDQLLRERLFCLILETQYAEKGVLKTHAKPEDFAELGLKPFFYKCYLMELDEMNEAVKKMAPGREDEITRAYAESRERNMEKLAEHKLRILELEKKVAEQKEISK